MTMTTKNEIFSRYLSEYINKKTTKARRGEILDNVCDVVGMHRKAAIKKLGFCSLGANLLAISEAESNTTLLIQFLLLKQFGRPQVKFAVNYFIR